MADYVPKNDAEFTIWQSNLITIVSTNSTGWGIPPADLSALVEKQTAWDAAYAAAPGGLYRGVISCLLRDTIARQPGVYTTTLGAQQYKNEHDLHIHYDQRLRPNKSPLDKLNI